MAERISAAEAKAQFSALMAKVAHGGARFIIERRGKPYVGVVGVEDLERLEAQATSSQRRGALALVGAWRELDDAELEALVASIYAQRERDLGRPVELET